MRVSETLILFAVQEIITKIELVQGRQDYLCEQMTPKGIFAIANEFKQTE